MARLIFPRTLWWELQVEKPARRAYSGVVCISSALPGAGKGRRPTPRVRPVRFDLAAAATPSSARPGAHGRSGLRTRTRAAPGCDETVFPPCGGRIEKRYSTRRQTLEPVQGLFGMHSKQRLGGSQPAVRFIKKRFSMRRTPDASPSCEEDGPAPCAFTASSPLMEEGLEQRGLHCSSSETDAFTARPRRCTGAGKNEKPGGPFGASGLGALTFRSVASA